MAAEPRTDSPKVSTPASSNDKLATATFGEGCFWCSEAVFQNLKGVKSVASGYSGGAVENPTYEDVCTGRTGHAEVIQVTYDPAVISFEDLLKVFWQTHDPTTLNRQGHDSGTQYRSAIFYHNDEQRQIAEKYKQQLDASKTFSFADRDRNNGVQEVLSGRKVPPGLLQLESDAAILPVRDPAEGGEIQQGIQGDAERPGGEEGRGCQVVLRA